MPCWTRRVRLRMVWPSRSMESKTSRGEPLGAFPISVVPHQKLFPAFWLKPTRMRFCSHFFIQCRGEAKNLLVFSCCLRNSFGIYLLTDLNWHTENFGQKKMIRSRSSHFEMERHARFSCPDNPI